MARMSTGMLTLSALLFAPVALAQSARLDASYVDRELSEFRISYRDNLDPAATAALTRAPALVGAPQSLLSSPGNVFLNSRAQLAGPNSLTASYTHWVAVSADSFNTHVSSAASLLGPAAGSSDSECASPLPATRTIGAAWDNAHTLLKRIAACPGYQIKAAGQHIRAIEPRMVVSNQPAEDHAADRSELLSASGVNPPMEPPSPAWPSFKVGGKPVPGWHLGSGYSQLQDALKYYRASGKPLATLRDIRIAHLDTGYPINGTDSAAEVPVCLGDCGAAPKVAYPMPWRFDRELSADCYEQHAKELKNPECLQGSPWGQDISKSDPVLIKTPLHGSGTLSALAGPDYICDHCPAAPAATQMGGNPYSTVFEVRVSPAFIHFNEETMSMGIDYAVQQGADVISLSHGGFPSAHLADTIENAYQHGVPILAASGDFFYPFSPSTTVFPARYGQVMGVAGATADWKSYSRSPCYWCVLGFLGGRGFWSNLSEWMIRGNYGPPAITSDHMIAAFAPNVTHWSPGRGTMTMDGDGTSYSTPQAAAAASIWLAHNAEALPSKSATDAWRRAEGAYQAMLAAARLSVAPDGPHPGIAPDYVATYFGAGVLRADDMLRAHPYASLDLQDCRRRPHSHADLFWVLDALTSTGVIPWTFGRGAVEPDVQEAFSVQIVTELEQVAYRDRNVSDLLTAIAAAQPKDGCGNPARKQVDAKTWSALADALSSEGSSSKTLQRTVARLAGSK